MAQAVAALQRNIESCLATRTLEGRLGHVPKVERATKNTKITKVGPRLVMLSIFWLVVWNIFYFPVYLE